MENEAEGSKAAPTRPKRTIKRPSRFDDETPSQTKKAALSGQKKGAIKKFIKRRTAKSGKTVAKKQLAKAVQESGKQIKQLKDELDDRIKDNSILEAARQTAASELSTSEESDE